MKAHIVKQAQVKEVQIGGNFFYIRPYPAFKSIHMTGELSALAGPLLAALAPLFDDKNNLDTNINDAIPTIGQAFNTLSGDKLERMMKELLIGGKNITVDIDGQEDPEILTESLANELFCGDAQDMFVLAFYVIQYNFSSFFSKLENRFGSVFEKLQSTSNNMVNSMRANSPI